MDDVKKLQKLIDESKYIVFFGGAGVSTESGIKDFRGKNGLYKGYAASIIGRFIFSFISGMAFFGSSAAEYGMAVPVYSFCYNGAYIFPEAAITFVVLALPPVKNACMRIKALAISEGN